MGSAYTTIAADVAARFQRLAGKRVSFVTGTDEHGEKIAAAAAAKGLSPQEHCDGVAAQFQALWKQARSYCWFEFRGPAGLSDAQTASIDRKRRESGRSAPSGSCMSTS